MTPTMRTTAAALGLGALFDLTFNGQTPGLAAPLFVAAAAAAFRWTTERSAERDALLVASVAFSVIVITRSEAAVLGPALLAVGGLMTLAVTGRGAATLTLTGATARSIAVARSAIRAPGFVLEPVRPLLERSRFRPAMRACGLAVLVVGVFAALFASADRVFADALVPRFDAAGVAGHAGMLLAGTWLAAGMWTARALAADPGLIVHVPPLRTRFTPAEWTTALAGLTTLFATFVAVQLAFLFGGRGRVEVTPGLTYAAYARSGFVQLLVAGALTVAVLLGAWDLGERRTPAHRRRFAVLAGTLTSLCLVILASAALRLALYQHAFGFTITRLAAWFAIGGVGAALIGLVTAIALERRRAVVAGAIAIALASVVGLAVVSPSAFVAHRNIERFDATGSIDIPYLTTLGPEAVPALVTLLPRLPDERQVELRASLCEHTRTGTGDWRSWSLARSRALRAIGTLECGKPD